jgi:hypothetical protein
VNLQDVKGWVLTASREDLEQISGVMKIRRDQLGQLHALEFQPGDRVYFDAGNRGVIRGVFQNIARKNAIVKADTGGNWRVSPHLLHADDSVPSIVTQPSAFVFTKK